MSIRFRYRELREYREPASLRLDVCVSDHLPPLFGLVRNELAETGRRTSKNSPTRVGKPRPDHGLAESDVNLPIERSDDLRRSVPGSAHAKPGACLIARYKFAYRR